MQLTAVYSVLTPGETALVQLGNVAELYITFFALLKLGVAPVLALFSHQRSELNAYASQIEPALLIADRQHALFSGDDFLNTFVAEHSSIRVVQLLNDSGEHNLQDAINHPAEDFTATPIHLIKQYMFNMCRIKFCCHTVI